MSREISIFLDTNVIQSFFDGKNGASVFLDSLGIRSDFHDLAKFIDENDLSNKVEICIPEIVVLEMKQHMKDGFLKQRQKLQDHLKEHKKVFGNIIDLSAIEIKYDLEQYSDYVVSLFDDFFSTPKNFAKQIPYPRQEPIIDTLISKAIAGERPFFTGKIGAKNHSDAGFKDSVIAETIFEYHRVCGRLCILVTHDSDFSREFENKITDSSEFVLFPSVGATIDALADYYEISPQAHLVREFTVNTYWHEYLLNEAGVKLDGSVTDYQVENVSLVEDNVFLIKMSFLVNEAKYLFFIKFDSIANDIVELNYRIEDD